MRSALLSLVALLSIGSLTLACAADAEPIDDGSAEPRPDRAANKTPSGGAEETVPSSPTPTPDPSAKPPASTPDKPAVTTCQAARDLGELSGDMGVPSLTTQGKCSEWLRLRITEDQTSALAAGEKLTVTLVPPTGADFDLRVHMTSEADVVDCVTAKATSELPGDKTESVKLEWGEVYAANNADDSRNIAIEVRSKDGSCSAQTWTLLVQGNQ